MAYNVSRKPDICFPASPNKGELHIWIEEALFHNVTTNRWFKGTLCSEGVHYTPIEYVEQVLKNESDPSRINVATSLLLEREFFA